MAHDWYQYLPSTVLDLPQFSSQSLLQGEIQSAHGKIPSLCSTIPFNHEIMWLIPNSDRLQSSTAISRVRCVTGQAR